MSGSIQKQFHAVSLSGGKDSTAMLLMMIEKGMQIDELGAAAMNDYIKKIKHIVLE